MKAIESHASALHLVGLFWTNDQTVADTDAKTFTWQHTTLTRKRH